MLLMCYIIYVSRNLIFVLHQLTEFGIHSPSTLELQVPKYSADQLQKSLATQSNKRQTMKANGMNFVQ